MNVIETDQILDALKMAHAVLRNSNSRIGQIIGQPGTGKTVASQFIAEKFNGIRVRAFSGMTRKDLAVQLARELGHDNPTMAYGPLMSWLMSAVANRLILIDEANHLGWRQLEPLRDLSDETGAGVILVGTELLERQFNDGRTGVYLAQMTSRIGAKRVRFQPLDALEHIAAFFIQPVFGQAIVKKSVLKEFKTACHGFWREASELSATCLRIMEAQGFKELTPEIVREAAQFMAKGRG